MGELVGAKAQDRGECPALSAGQCAGREGERDVRTAEDSLSLRGPTCRTRVRVRQASLMRWLHGQSDAHSHERAAELILEPDPALHSMLVLQLGLPVHTRPRLVLVDAPPEDPAAVAGWLAELAGPWSRAIG